MAILGDTKAVSLSLLDGVIGNLNPKTTEVYDLGTSGLKWRNIYGALKGNADTATSATKASLLTNTHVTNEAAAMPTTKGLFGIYTITSDSSGLSNDGHILSGTWHNNDTNFGYQLFIDTDPTYKMALRQRNSSGVWQAWKLIPMADGTNASGTWGISITGNAATATSASSVPLSGVTSADDLKAIEALTGTTGLLKKTAANTWTLDTTAYTTNTGTVTKVTAGTGLSIGTTAQGNFTTTGTINHTNSVTAQTTQALYPIKIDAQGHISAYGTAVTPLTASSTLDATKLSGTIPASCYTNTTSFTITANATDGYWDLTGTNGTNAVTYSLAPYSSRQSSACFYTGTTAPNGTTRLNYNGYLYATKLYSGGSEVLTSHQSLTGYIPKSTLSGAYDIMYSSAANTPTRLAANTTATKKFLRMTGTGSAGAAPAWDTVTKTDVGLSAVENKSSATIRGELTSSNVTTALGYTPADADDLSDYLPLTGGTLTGPLTIGSTLTFYEGSSFRIKYGTESPETAGLQNGDIYFYIQG